MNNWPVSSFAAGFSALMMVISLFLAPSGNIDKLLMLMFAYTACAFLIEGIVYPRPWKFIGATIFLAFAVLQYLKI